MSRFLNGMLLGLGIGLLIAPRPGVETRRLLAASLRSLSSTGLIPRQEEHTHPTELRADYSQPQQDLPQQTPVTLEAVSPAPGSGNQSSEEPMLTPTERSELNPAPIRSVEPEERAKSPRRRKSPKQPPNEPST